MFAVIAAVLLVAYAVESYGWYTTALEGTPGYGVNFGCKRAEYLCQDCAALFAELLDDLGVRLVRLSVYWSDVVGEPGVYDDREIATVRAADPDGHPIVISHGDGCAPT